MITLATSALAAEPPDLQLKDGDRIVYLGDTFVERDQSYGYLETLVTILHPKINFTFRNLGWSGDTVWGDARARFGTRADGFKHLKEHVLALKPTVILVAYGTNESFAGESGIKDFEAGLNTLLDSLAETKATIVMILPMDQENLGPPLPDPAHHNRDLALYRSAIDRVATARHIASLDLSAIKSRLLGGDATPLTDDGQHLPAWGNAVLAERMATILLRTHIKVRQITPDATGGVESSKGWNVTNYRADGNTIQFDAQGETLPLHVLPKRVDADPQPTGGGVRVQIDGLSDSKPSVKIDGKPVRIVDHGGSFSILSGPEIDQVEKVRSLINKKNELYFHRWRPQNETYLFGFRKHEQGNNAIEIPQFDPLIAELEAEINRQKQPAKHTYEIIRQDVGE